MEFSLLSVGEFGPLAAQFPLGAGDGHALAGANADEIGLDLGDGGEGIEEHLSRRVAPVVERPAESQFHASFPKLVGDEILPSLYEIAAGQFNRQGFARRRHDRNLEGTRALHGWKAWCTNLTPSHALLGRTNSSHDSRRRNRVDMRQSPPTCSCNIRARPCGSAATRLARRTRRSPAARPPRPPGARLPGRRRTRRPRSPARA